MGLRVCCQIFFLISPVYSSNVEIPGILRGGDSGILFPLVVLKSRDVNSYVYPLQELLQNIP